MNVKRIFIVLAVAMLMFSIALATTYASEVKSDKKDTEVTIESKEKKVSSYKVTWNANGGKIGSKKTVTTAVQKGAKVKLATTPKRMGFKFVGWYSKQVGGSKITKNTKVKKSITYYAQWKKVLTSEEKKLVGSWLFRSVSGSTYNSLTDAFEHVIGTVAIVSFNANGAYDQIFIHNTAYSKYAQFTKGSWRVSGGTVYMANVQVQTSKDGGKTFSSWMPRPTPNESMKIKHGSDKYGQFFNELKYDAIWRKIKM